MGIFKKRQAISIKIIDDNIIEKKNPSITKGIIGGALFGTTGAIIGTASGKAKVEKYVTFLVTYDDGSTEKFTDKEGGTIYDGLMRKKESLEKE